MEMKRVSCFQIFEICTNGFNIDIESNYII